MGSCGRSKITYPNLSWLYLCFKKMFEKCMNANENFELGLTLQGIVTDWSNAVIRGLKTAIGKDTAAKLQGLIHACLGFAAKVVSALAAILSTRCREGIIITGKRKRKEVFFANCL